MTRLLPALLLPLLCALSLHAQFIRSVDLNPAGMAYSPLTERLYVAVADQDDSLNLCIVDPFQAQTDTCLSLPGRMQGIAVSDDGAYLYIGTIFPSRIHRFHLPDLQPELSFTPANGMTAYKFLPLPGAPKSVLTVHSTPAGGVLAAVYDDETARPNAVNTANEFAFGVTNSVLFGLKGWNQDNSVLIYNLDPNGITQLGPWSVQQFPPNTAMKTVDNLLVMSNGFIYNIAGGHPDYYSFYFNEPFKPGGPFAVDRDSGVVYFGLGWDPYPLVTRIRTYTIGGTQKSILGLPGLPGGPSKLVACGGNGRLALHIDNKIVLLNPCNSSAPKPVIDYPDSGYCEGDTITLTGPPGASAYFWSTGENTPSIQVSLSREYWLSVSDSTGCLTVPSDTIHPPFDTKPPRPLVPSGPGQDIVCNDDTLILRVQYPVGWGVPLETHWSTGVVADSILVTGGGTFTAVFVTEHGCVSDTSYPRNIEHIVAVQPVISMSGNVLVSSVIYGNQWFFKGLPLQDATFPQIALAGKGVYQVQATTPEGCVSPISEPYYYNYIPIYPNPVQNEIYLQYDSFGQIASYMIVDIQGNVVLEGNASNLPLKVAILQPGYYQIRWFDANGVLVGFTTFMKI